MEDCETSVISLASIYTVHQIHIRCLELQQDKCILKNANENKLHMLITDHSVEIVLD